jgi:hypothetical protein
MLAQPAGLAPYDRVSSEPLLSAVTGAVLLGLLSLSIGRLSADQAACCTVPSRAAAIAIDVSSGDGAGGPAAPLAVDAGGGTSGTNRTSATDPLARDQVARLGAELFGRHLLAVEAAGVLLLVALIGSIAMVARNAEAAAHAADGEAVA